MYRRLGVSEQEEEGILGLTSLPNGLALLICRVSRNMEDCASLMQRRFDSWHTTGVRTHRNRLLLNLRHKLLLHLLKCVCNVVGGELLPVLSRQGHGPLSANALRSPLQ